MCLEIRLIVVLSFANFFPSVKENGAVTACHPLNRKLADGVRVQMVLEEALGRKLTQFESDMLVHPRLCMVCLEGDQVRSHCHRRQVSATRH